MGGKRTINTGGGTYNESNTNTSGGMYIESIHGNSTNIQGSYLNINQDLSQAAAQIQKLLIQLQTQGYSSKEAQNKVAQDLATQAKSEPRTKTTLTKWRQYLGDAAANGLIGEAAVEVIKTALRLSGIPLP
ncbi:MAG: hypothetical protein F6K41_22355 [Symploca sp. SIO3E6]|nr:hypothetical protein [Caldora sp. SIO3E6]